MGTSKTIRLASSVLLAASAFAMLGGSAHAASGDLDPTFGSDGVVLRDFGRYAEARGVAVQPDGRVVVAGVTERQDPEDQTDRVFVARFRGNGKLDRSFADEGRRIVDLPDNRDRAAGVVVTDDGRIAVGVGTGRIDHYGDEFFDAGVLQLRANGSIDRAFGRRGLSLVGRGKPEELEIAGDGDLVLASTFADGYCCGTGVTRLNPTGTPDRRFSGDGFEPTGTIDMSYDDRDRIGLALAGPRTYLTAGDYPETIRVIAVERTGAPDEGFDGPGAREGFGSYTVPEVRGADAAATDEAGRLLVGLRLSGANASAMRILPSGATDDSFGPGGLSAGTFAGGGVEEVLLSSAEALLVGGGDVLATRRVLEGGQNDPAWGQAGITEDPAGRKPVVVTGSLTPQGPVVAGSAKKRGSLRTLVLVARYQD